MSDNEKFQYSHTPVNIEKYKNNKFEVTRSRIIESMIPDGQNKNAIDIGAGPGYFSSILKSRNWKTTAIDTDPENIENLKKIINQAILGDAISELSHLEPDSYDLVLALELIEHMPRELGEKLLKLIYKTLVPGGALLISTPNKLSPEGLGGYYVEEKLRGKKWYAWDHTHIYIYSSFEIIRLLKSFGFSVSRVTGYWYEGDLPFGIHWRLPIESTARAPFNVFGYNIIIECTKP